MSDVKILDVNSIDENQLPSIIASQFNVLTELENKVQEFVNEAAQAKQKATDAQVSAGPFQKKVAIELLQNATKCLAEAQIAAVDAQKISFEYQSKLTEITKFLFGLGVSNIAMNRSVVRELELRLKGASDDKISDLAKQELRNVIMQLKAQEDMFKKQTDLTGKVKEHQNQIKELDKQVDNLKEQEQKQNEKIAEQDKEYEAQNKKISENTQKLSEHSKTLELQHVKDTQIEKIAQENANKVISLQKEIQKQYLDIKTYMENRNNEANNKITELSSKIDKLQYITSKIGWKIAISVVAIGSLLLNILQITGVF